MRARVVIVDRVDPDRLPPYQVVGRSTCVGCEAPVMLGTKTVELILTGQAEPLCHECGAKFIPKDARPSGHVDDE